MMLTPEMVKAGKAPCPHCGAPLVIAADRYCPEWNCPQLGRHPLETHVKEMHARWCKRWAEFVLPSGRVHQHVCCLDKGHDGPCKPAWLPVAFALDRSA